MGFGGTTGRQQVQGNAPETAGPVTGTAVTAEAALSSQAVRWCVIQNTHATLNMFVCLGAAATSSHLKLGPGQRLEPPIDNLNLIHTIRETSDCTFVVLWTL